MIKDDDVLKIQLNSIPIKIDVMGFEDYYKDIVQTVDINGYEYDFIFNYDLELMDVFDECGNYVTSSPYDIHPLTPSPIKKINEYLCDTWDFNYLLNVIMELISHEKIKIHIDIPKFDSKKGEYKDIKRMVKIEHKKTVLRLKNWSDY